MELGVGRWFAYIAGAVLVLMHECGARVSGNLSILIHSAVPEGMGVSSSAALEVATMSALAAAIDVKLPGRRLAQLCQKVCVHPAPAWEVVKFHQGTRACHKGCDSTATASFCSPRQRAMLTQVENECVGAPCGIMDQMAVTLGAQSELMALLCQPAELQSPVAIPANVSFWGLDSGETQLHAGLLPSPVQLQDEHLRSPCGERRQHQCAHAAGERHSVGGADYGTVRAAAFMGLRMLSTAAKGVISSDGNSHAGLATRTESNRQNLIGALESANISQ